MFAVYGDAYGPGTATIVLMGQADQEFAAGEGGFQVNNGGSWIPSTLWQYDPLFDPLTIIVSTGADTTPGQAWRMSSEFDGLTVSGLPIYPRSGILEAMPEFMKTEAAKIAAEKLLTRPSLSR